MIARHAFIYIGTRIFAAILNLISVAAFARLAGPHDFGQYLLFQASAFIVYGFTVQWLRMSFFAAYKADHSNAIVATFAKSIVTLMSITVAAGVLVVWSGLGSASAVGGTMALTLGLAIFDTFYEIARARLRVGLIGTSVLIRSVLIPVGGVAGFAMTGTAFGLAAGVAVGQLLAALPLIADVRSQLSTPFSKSVAEHYASYGSTLILAFGVNAVGQSADRLLLAKFESVAAIGPYGAVGDVIKQSLVVMSDAVSGSYIPHAKSAATDGDGARARDILTQAFRVYSFITMFGSAAILCFAPQLIRLMFGEAYEQSAHTLIPYFTGATVIFVFRAYYFGQAIYFLGRASAELKSSVAMVVTATIAAAALIPLYGTVGAAAALLAAQVASCAVAMYAASKSEVMPFPLLDFLGIAAAACVAALGVDTAALLPASAATIFVVQALILSVAAAIILVAYDIFGIGERVRDMAIRGKPRFSRG